MLYLRNIAQVPRLEYDVIAARRLDPMIHRVTTIETSITAAKREDIACSNSCYLKAFRMRKCTKDNNQLLLSQLLQLTQVHQDMKQDRLEVIKHNPGIQCSR